MAINTRFKDADYMALIPNLTITLIGNGGIGSWLALGLARLGIAEMFNYEQDNVEEHNLGGQLFRVSDIGDTKEESMEGILYDFANFDSIRQLGLFHENSECTPIVFCAVDDNKVRRDIFDAWYAEAVSNNWEFEMNDVDGNIVKLPYMLFDGRMSFYKYDVYCVTKDTADIHRKDYIPLSKEVADDTCAMKANPMIGTLCAAKMLHRFVNLLSNTIERNSGLDLDICSAPWRTRDCLLFNTLIVEQCPIPIPTE